ncbi:hypothetical protein CIPAW_05G079600 [Carya illinoinensis]|uniref:Uncharacterized protein n=1 Tax=Carya illinoinensis TaxID=32201 RepID=A0A8T1QH13_CARIL|nr:hypothetical protein CIPAW_05G079600 [Carya illinoinensis]
MLVLLNTLNILLAIDLFRGKATFVSSTINISNRKAKETNIGSLIAVRE